MALTAPEPGIGIVENRPDLAHVDVRYVADLARLALTDEEVARYQGELDDILDYVAQLGELDVTGIEPTAHANPLANVLRDDVADQCMSREDMIRNAPATVEEELVRVPAVIEEEGQ